MFAPRSSSLVTDPPLNEVAWCDGNLESSVGLLCATKKCDGGRPSLITQSRDSLSFSLSLSSSPSLSSRLWAFLVHRCR